MRDFFTVVFNGTIEDLKTNPLFVRSPFGEPEHATNGDVITEVEDLIGIKRDLVAVLASARAALNDIPIAANGYVKVDQCIAAIDMILAKARNV